MRRHVAVASRTDTGSSNGPCGIGVHAMLLLVHEPRRGDRPVGVRLARGQHDPGPGATEHHPEQPPFVLQAGAVALGLRDGPLERRQVEHRLRAGQAGEVPFDGSRDDHGVELGTDGAVRGQHANRVERRGIARPIARAVLAGVERSHERLRRWVGRVAGLGDDVGEPDDDVDLPPGAGRALGVGHQTRRVRQVLPEDPERFEHRPVGHGPRVLEHLAHDVDLGGLGLREAFRVIERRADRSLHRLGRAHHPARGGRRQPHQVGREDGFDQLLALVGVGRQPPERQHVRERGRLRGERHAALGERARHAGVVERPQQRADVRALPPDDDGELVPGHALLHVEPAELARDRGVLLRRVRRGPRLDGDRRFGAMRRLQLDHVRAAEPLGEPADRDVGRALEREDVRVGIAGHDQVGRRQPGHDGLGGQRRVLVVVDQQVVQQRLAVGGHLRRPLQQRREVHDVASVDHVLVLAIEAGELVPAGQAGLLRSRLDVLGAEQRFLRPREELPDLVGERAHAEHVPVRGPRRSVLIVEQLLHQRELVARGQQVGRLRVIQPPEPSVQHVARQSVNRHDAELRERALEPREQGVALGVARRGGAHDERHPFGIGAALEQAGEPLAEDRGLPGSGIAGDQERAGVVSEDPLLLGVG